MARIRPIAPVIGAALAFAYGWWVTGLEPFAGATTVAVVGAGALAALAARTTRTGTAPGRLTMTGTAVWGVLLVALVAWQLAAYFGEPRFEHPTLSSLANTALDARSLRASAFVAWLAGALWLARQ